MEEHFPEAKATRHGNDNTAIIFVSLYFLLLAFFIYLTSISVPKEERIQEVIGSIDVAFKGVDRAQSYVSKPDVEGEDLGLAQFHAELKQVFEASIPLVENEVTEDGTQLLFRVPITQLFMRGDVAYRDNRDGLFEDIADVMIKRGGVAPTDVEILFDLWNKLPSGEKIEDNLSARRLGFLVNSLLNKGVAKRNVFIGVSEEGRNQVIFKFYERDAVSNLFVKSKEAK